MEQERREREALEQSERTWLKRAAALAAGWRTIFYPTVWHRPRDQALKYPLASARSPRPQIHPLCLFGTSCSKRQMLPFMSSKRGRA